MGPVALYEHALLQAHTRATGVLVLVLDIREASEDSSIGCNYHDIRHRLSSGVMVRQKYWPAKLIVLELRFGCVLRS